MSRVLRLLLQLCLFRSAPQDLPYSPRLAQGLVLLAVGINLVFMRLFDLGDAAPADIALSLALLLGLPWLLLALRQRLPRYVQTLSAFAGSSVLYMLAVLPLVQPIKDLPPPSPDVPPSAPQALIVVLWLGLLGWKLAINAHIWRHALDWPRGAAILLVIGLFLLELALGQMLFAAGPKS
jgi:hypothetical protein